MRKLIIFSILAGLLFSSSGVSCKQEKEEAISSEELQEWIGYMASDEMRGRANGSGEMLIVADWLSAKYKEFGLKPLFDNGEYLQKYSFTRREQSINEQNVIGLIEGNDPLLKYQYIIISAHFDHIGVRENDTRDSIYNGADDNAAGTSTLLGVAKTIMASGVRPGRTIVFTAFSGEEMGIRGSRYFVANSPIPLENCYADINFEMTGHSEFLGKNRYYMTGCNISDLDNIIGEYNKTSDWILVDTIAIAERLFYASDNIAFSRVSSSDGINRGIPSGTFATTATADYIHSPGDEGELFDYDNMAGLVEYFSNMILWLSNYKSEINFTDPSFKRVESKIKN